MLLRPRGKPKDNTKDNSSNRTKATSVLENVPAVGNQKENGGAGVTTRRKKSGRGLSKRSINKQPAKKSEGVKSEGVAKKKAPGRRKSVTKRTSSILSGAASKPGGRATKRRKTEEKPAARSRSVSSSSHGGKGGKRTKKVKTREVVVIKGGRDHIVPPGFRLEREGEDEEGKNWICGKIAHYDSKDKDPLQCREYVSELFQNLFDVESRHLAEIQPYIREQADITSNMRKILVDWIMEVHMKFKLVPDTLFLCVQLIDRFLGREQVNRRHLQLVGITALLLAAKHEEIYPPQVRDLVYITDRAYDRQQVLDTEQTMLVALEWRISLPTANPFLHRFLSITGACKVTRHCSQYYLERSLLEHDMLVYRPSVVAASSVVLAINNTSLFEGDMEGRRNRKKSTRRKGFPQILMEYTRFDENELIDCASLIASKVAQDAEDEPEFDVTSGRALNAAKKKFAHRNYSKVSTEFNHPAPQEIRDILAMRKSTAKIDVLTVKKPRLKAKGRTRPVVSDLKLPGSISPLDG